MCIMYFSECMKEYMYVSLASCVGNNYVNLIVCVQLLRQQQPLHYIPIRFYMVIIAIHYVYQIMRINLSV